MNCRYIVCGMPPEYEEALAIAMFDSRAYAEKYARELEEEEELESCVLKVCEEE